MEIRRGQWISIAELYQHDSIQALHIVLSISGMYGSVDFACFGLDDQQRLSDDRYMIFYNQPNSPCGGVKLMKPEACSVTFLHDLTICYLKALSA